MQKIIDTDSYASRIVSELRKKDPIKYKHLSTIEVKRHLNHIGYCLVRIMKTHNDEFNSPFFAFRRAFRKFYHMVGRHNKYQAKRMLELSNRVQNDNVIDSIGIKTIAITEKTPTI